MARLSKDQKRQKKLAERARKQPTASIEPYQGRKYEKPEFALALFLAEKAILEGFEVSGRRLTDQDVKESLEYLILDLRGQKPAEPPAVMTFRLEDGREEDFFATRIKENWEGLFRKQIPHSLTDQVGILRKILSSLNLRTRPFSESQSYLLFLVKFMGKIGVSFHFKNEVLLNSEEFTS